MLAMERISMSDAGVYQCTAENGVGKPVSLDMKLDVLCELMFAVNVWNLQLTLFPWIIAKIKSLIISPLELSLSPPPVLQFHPM